MKSLLLETRPKIWAMVTAGLMYAPEYLSSIRIKDPTVRPKMAATITVDSGKPMAAEDVRITEAGPMRTRRYVPSDSERHCLNRDGTS